MKVEIPELALVALVGTSGSGKSTFARRHFLPTEVLSSDRCRGIVSDDENNQSATNDAFDVLYYIAAKRLAAGNSQSSMRQTFNESHGNRSLTSHDVTTYFRSRLYSILPAKCAMRETPSGRTDSSALTSFGSNPSSSGAP